MAASTRQGSGRSNRTAVKRPAGRSPQPERRRKTPWRARSERARELVALVLFGIAAFLLFALIASEKGGVVGRGVGAALEFAFGRLAILVPLAFVGIGVLIAVAKNIVRSQRFWGVIVFLVGLFLLMGGAVPPFGERSDELFVRAAFEPRAGAVGELLYAAVHGLMGIVGVGIVGWILELAGFAMVTGVTALWVGRHTRRAARAVKTSAGRSAFVTRLRDDAERAAPVTEGMGWSAARTSPPTPHLGPVDLVEGAAQQPVAAAVGGSRGVFGDAFDDWVSGRPAAHNPQVVAAAAPSGTGIAEIVDRGRGVLDGAEAFADIYDASDHRPSAAAKAAAVAGAGLERTVTVGTPGTQTGASEVRLTVDGMVDEDDDGVEGGGQTTLPGLARKPQQAAPAPPEAAYVLPEADMLRKSAPVLAGRDGGQRDVASVLLQALSQFGVEARVMGMVVGPRVTRYELQLAPGTKVSKVTALKDDLAYALATTEIRILAPIPGKSAVGVEVPNQQPDFVTLGDIYREFPKSAGPLMVWLGKDISGKAIFADLTKLPHLLIAGTTGSGKSGCVNCLVSSILLRSTPEQVRMIMIDPKKVELSHYDRIPHLLVPVVTNMKDAAGVLHNVVKEMEDRYELMELDRTRNLAEMNKIRARRGERLVPYIVIVIDELADLMMASPQEVEDYVIRLAQKSRAVGIHLVVATQRPSADVITGMIKANIPSRIAFAVSSQTDSRVILDVNGAETLLGQGDMLFKPLGSSHLERIQGAYITEEEIASLVNHWRHEAEPEFREELLQRPADPKKGGDDDLFDPDSDELLADAAQLVIETGSASVSMLQRRLRVGYTRAGRLIDMLERRGIVGPWEGSKPRQILIDSEDVEHMLAVLRADERSPDGELDEG